MKNEQLSVDVASGSREGHRVVRLAGPLTLNTVFDFQSAVRAEKAPTVILDLSQVPYIDSTGLGSVINAYISCINSGRRLVIVGVTERVRTLFQITQVEKVLTIFATLEDAERGFSKPPDA